jgi:5'-deoxynucleotidase YfbR-like HD superfamily hydrolase
MEEENLYEPNSIRTLTGYYFNYLKMDPESINIEDIAHALSNMPRWLGHTKKFFSVAQHCCWCHDANIEPEDERLERLMHDATEAYLGDCPSPLKSLLPQYKELEKKLSIVIAKKFGFNYPYSPATKLVDRAALEIEWEDMKLEDKMECWSPEKAKAEFLKRFNDLK